MIIEHKHGSCSIAYNDPIVEFFVRLPSGRKLWFCDMQVGTYDTDSETAKEIADRKAEIASMIEELRSMHMSDCAVHNEPALPAGPCDCK